jgi:hypothetical protein
MDSKQLIEVVQQLERDCQSAKFVPYAEGDLRAEAYTRLGKAVRGANLVVNTEVRFYRYGGQGDASKCDVVVWDKWASEQSREEWGCLNLSERKPKLAVEFKYWGVAAPDKMILYFKADIERLAGLGAKGRGVTFLYVARRFRDHERILKEARALDGKDGIRVMVVDGAKVYIGREPLTG